MNSAKSRVRQSQVFYLRTTYYSALIRLFTREEFQEKIFEKILLKQDTSTILQITYIY